MTKKWTFISVLILVLMVSVGCTNSGDVNTGSLSLEDYKSQMQDAIDNLDAGSFARLLSQFRTDFATDDGSFEKSMGEAIDLKVNALLTEGRGQEASQFIANLYDQTDQFIADMYYHYATDAPDLPEVRLGKDETGKEFVVIYHSAYIYYSFDGLNYKLYDEGTHLLVGGQSHLYMYAQNGFANKSDIVEYALDKNEVFDTIIDKVTYDKRYQFLSYYMEGMSRSRFYLEAQEIETISDHIIVESMPNGYYGQFSQGNETTYVLLVTDEQSDVLEETAKKIVTYYKANDMKTTMANYGFNTCETYLVTNPSEVITQIQAVSSDDTVITQIDPLKQTLTKLSRFYDQDEAYLILWGEDGGTIVLDAQVKLMTQSKADTVIQHYMERTHQ